MAYHAFNKSANVASICCVHYETTFLICTQHLYDYISTRHHEQLTTNLNIQHDLFVELETFYDHVDQNSVKRAMVMFTINMSKRLMSYTLYQINIFLNAECTHCGLIQNTFSIKHLLLHKTSRIIKYHDMIL